MSRSTFCLFPKFMECVMLSVIDRGIEYDFSFDDIEKYHGPLAPGGIAHAYKVMQRVFPILSPDKPIDRRLVEIHTSFVGPGARDAFEMVTRAVTENRYNVEPEIKAEYPDIGYRNRYVFKLSYGDKTVTAILREGHVRDEFLALGAKTDRTKDENIHLAWLKQEMTDRLMKLHATSVYDILQS